MDIDMNTGVELLKNKSTGSTYYVIGQTPNLTCSLRVWVMNWVEVPLGVAHLGVRVRFDTKDGSEANIGTLADFEFPNTKWTGGGSGYVSKFAMSTLGFPASTFQALGEHVEKAGVIESILLELQAKFPSVVLSHPMEDLVQVFRKHVVSDLPVLKNTPPPYTFSWVDEKGSPATPNLPH